MHRTATLRQGCVARERAVSYSALQSPAEAALAKIRQGLAELAQVEPALSDDDELGAVALEVGAAASRLTAQEGRFVHAFDTRRAYRNDACVTTFGWLRLKTTLGPGASKRRVNRAKLLERMPALREAFEAGEVRVEHVDAVVYRATPSRMEGIAQHDATLTTLARTGEPRHVAVAVQRIIDQIDDDGSDDPPACDNEHLRGLHLRDGFCGLGDLSGTTTTVLSELLRRTNDVFGTADAADTPAQRRRTPSQRFHDALQAALQVALDNHHGAAVGGVRTHVVLFADLFTLLGCDAVAKLRPRLSSGGGIDPQLARHLIATTNPTMRAVVGLGPWQPVSVGRVRSLPDWLRVASHLGHPHCRGPGCDVPACLCDSDHVEPFCQGGATTLANCVPMCHPHNVLKHGERWNVTFDVETGEVTWTSVDGRRVITLPPPDI